MYISGDQYSFEKRLHTLAQSGVDLDSFRIEGAGYTGLDSGVYYNRWNAEYNKKILIFSGVSQTGNAFNY